MTQHSRPRKKTQKDDKSPGFRIEVDGQTYTIRQSDITPRDTRALRQETGYSWAGLMREASRDFDIDLLAAVVWLARRVAGDGNVTYDDVLGELRYDMDITVGDAPAEDESPEA